MDKSFEKFEIVGFTQQVVAGTIFEVKVRIADGETGFIHFKLFRPLPHTGAEPEIMAWEVDRVE
jgi:hypothetical protein